MSVELKPCPFCGGEAKTIKGTNLNTDKPFWKAYCKQCQIRTDPKKRLKCAVEAWNTRHIPEGYALVPVEPTEAMERSVISLSGDYEGNVNPFNAYAAMIAAAQEESK